MILLIYAVALTEVNLILEEINLIIEELFVCLSV